MWESLIFSHSFKLYMYIWIIDVLTKVPLSIFEIRINHVHVISVYAIQFYPENLNFSIEFVEIFVPARSAWKRPSPAATSWPRRRRRHK